MGLTVEERGYYNGPSMSQEAFVLDRSLPHSAEAEKAVLGLILLDNELYNQAIQRFSGPHVLQQVRAQVRRLRVWLPPHLDAYTVDGAWDLQDRYGLGYWDALIVSSAHQQGCRYLLTEALPHDQVLDAVRAINPFVLAPNELDTAE